MCASEAIRRLFKFKMNFNSHTKNRLAVHSPLNRMIYFKSGDEEHTLLRAASKDTTLTAWFKINQEDSEANKYMYQEIPNEYTFDIEWKLLKQKGNFVG